MKFGSLGGIFGKSIQGIPNRQTAPLLRGHTTPEKAVSRAIRNAAYTVETLDRRVLLSVVVSNISDQVNEAGSREFLISDFETGYSNPGGADLQSVKISSLPTHGTLAVSGTAVTVNQVFARGSISSLIYTPTSGYSGVDSFGWNATDGVAYAATAASDNLTVLAICT